MIGSTAVRLRGVNTFLFLGLTLLVAGVIALSSRAVLPSGPLNTEEVKRRSPRHGIVVAVSPPGADVGRDILQKGGNAVDAAVAVACVEVLQSEGWYIPDAAVAAGLAEVSWPARLEVVARRPLIVLDCAHNVASALALVQTLQASFPPARRLLIFAGSSDKDLAGMFRVLAPHFAHAYLTRYTTSLRSVPAERLAELLRANGNLPATLCRTPADAYQAARAAAAPDDVIVITGSVYLAGELRPLLVAG